MKAFLHGMAAWVLAAPALADQWSDAMRDRESSVRVGDYLPGVLVTLGIFYAWSKGKGPFHDWAEEYPFLSILAAFAVGMVVNFILAWA